MTVNDINSWYQRRTNEIRHENARLMAQDRQRHNDRMAVIKAMGAATRNGNYDELKRLAAELHAMNA